MEIPRKHRSPATLAAWLNKVLTGAADNLPLLVELGGRMEQETRWETRRIARALQALQASLAGLGLEGGQAEAAAAQLDERVGEVYVEGAAFLQSSEPSALALRPVLAGFQQEFRGTEKVVDRSALWLQEMAAGLAAGQAGEDMLGEREAQLRQRQRLLQDASNSARNVHALGDNLAKTRSALEQALQGQLRRVCGALQDRLAQPAAAARKELLAARSDAQMWVTQAVALLLRLQASRDRLVREEAALRDRCGRIPPSDTGHARLARIVLPQPEEEVLAGVVPPTGIEPVSSA